LQGLDSCLRGGRRGRGFRALSLGLREQLREAVCGQGGLAHGHQLALQLQYLHKT